MSRDISITCGFLNKIRVQRKTAEGGVRWTPEIALEELEAVKEGFFDVFLKMGKSIPDPVVHIDIPYDIFLSNKMRKSLSSKTIKIQEAFRAGRV